MIRERAVVGRETTKIRNSNGVQMRSIANIIFIGAIERICITERQVVAKRVSKRKEQLSSRIPDSFVHRRFEKESLPHFSVQ